MKTGLSHASGCHAGAIKSLAASSIMPCADTIRDISASVPAILWFAYPSLPLEAIRDAAMLGAIDALLMIEPYRHTNAATLDEELTQLGIARSAFLPW